MMCPPCRHFRSPYVINNCWYVLAGTSVRCASYCDVVLHLRSYWNAGQKLKRINELIKLKLNGRHLKDTTGLWQTSRSSAKSFIFFYAKSSSVVYQFISFNVLFAAKSSSTVDLILCFILCQIIVNHLSYFIFYSMPNHRLHVFLIILL